MTPLDQDKAPHVPNMFRCYTEALKMIKLHSCNAASSHIVINDFHQMNYVIITQGQFTINNNLSPVFLYLPRAGLISLSCLCCPRQGGSCMGKYTRQPATGNRLQTKFLRSISNETNSFWQEEVIQD